MEGSIPDPGVGTDLNPVAADNEFMVVLFLLPGEVLVDKALDKALVFNEVLN